MHHRSVARLAASTAIAAVALVAACADPVAPVRSPRLAGTFTEENPPKVNLCKYEFNDGSNLAGVDFPFSIVAKNADGATVYSGTVTLQTKQCADVYVANQGAVKLTITENPPAGTFAYLIAFAYTPDGSNQYVSNSNTVTLDVNGQRGAYVQFVNKGGYTPPPPSGKGARTPGYWKNDKKAWPASSVTIGGIVYSRAQADALMEAPTRTDKTYNMFEQLVATKLNLLVGTNSSCISETVALADAWMAANGPVGSGVAASSAAWQLSGSSLHATLDAYNNGLLCAPSGG